MCGKCEQQRKMKVGATSYGWVDLLIYGFSQIHAIHTHVRVDSFILAFFTSLSLLRSLGLRFCLKSQQIKDWLIDTNFGSHYSINVIKDETSLLSIFLSKLFGYGPKSDLDWEKETIQSFRYKEFVSKRSWKLEINQNSKIYPHEGLDTHTHKCRFQHNNFRLENIQCASLNVFSAQNIKNIVLKHAWVSRGCYIYSRFNIIRTRKRIYLVSNLCQYTAYPQTMAQHRFSMYYQLKVVIEKRKYHNWHTLDRLITDILRQ